MEVDDVPQLTPAVGPAGDVFPSTKIVAKKCQFCRHYFSLANIARHISRTHPHRVCRSSHHKASYIKKSSIIEQQETYKCPDGCGKTFDRQDNLDRHRKCSKCVHNFLFSCEFCQKGFSTQVKYNHHLHYRRCQKQFACFKCAKLFSSAKKNFLIMYFCAPLWTSICRITPTRLPLMLAFHINMLENHDI